jgi:hypothetical protein
VEAIVSEESESSPNFQRRNSARWASWIAVALLAGVALLDAVRQHWLGAGATAALALMFALQPTVLAQSATKAQQTRYLVIAIAGLVLQAWKFLSHATP